MPPLFDKRANLEARLGPSATVSRVEPPYRREEPVEVADEPEPPVAAAPPEPVPAPAAAPRVWAEGEGTVLAPGTVFEGTLRAAEPVQIAGTLQGTLEAEGPVTVEEGGRLVARVVAPEVVVAGFVDGRVQCHGRLEVRATGLVKGKLHVGTLRIEEGALLDGQLQMAGAVAAASIAPPEPVAVSDAPRARSGKAARAVEPAEEDLGPLAVNE